jgi:hypothetical protein
MKDWLYGLVCGVLAITSINATAGWLGSEFATASSIDSTVNGKHEFVADVTSGKLSVQMTTVGKDIWNVRDSGGFYFSPEVGDSEVVATIPPLVKEGDNADIGSYAKAGVMFRLSSYADAPMVMFFRETTLDNDGGTSRSRFIYRPRNGANVVDVKTTENHFPAYGDVRCRIVRKGNIFTAHYSTNAPSFTDWKEFAQCEVPEGTFAEGILAGVAAVPQSEQDGTTITVKFDDISVNQLVSAVAENGRITVSWSPDVIIGQDDMVETFSAFRSEVGDDNWTQYITVGGSSPTTFEDELAVPGISYRYRVEANVLREDSTSYTVQIGDSYRARIPLQTTNSMPATQNGLTTEYSQGGEKVGSYVYWTSVYNPWEGSSDWGGPDNRIYPAGARTGLTDLDNFTIAARGIFRVPTSGLYEFRFSADDTINFTINGQLLATQNIYIGRNVYCSPVYLEAGRNYPMTYNFAELTGGQSCQLRYRRVGDNDWAWVGPNCEPIPSPWTAVELGESPLFGNVIYNLDSKTFTLAASGLGWEGTFDEAQTCSMGVSAGDFDFVARLAIQTEATGKAGIMLRADAMATAPEQVVLSVTGRVAEVFLRTADGMSAQQADSITLPVDIDKNVLLRLSRRGELLRCFVTDGDSTNLEDWTQVGDPIELPEALAADAIAGLCSASGTRSDLYTAQFDRISMLNHAATTPEFKVTLNATADKVSVQVYESSPATQRTDTENAFVGYHWSDHLSNFTKAYNISATMEPPTNGVGTALGVDVAAGDAVTYTFTDEDLRKLVYFTAVGTETIFGESEIPAGIDSVHSYGYAREEPSETGTGMHGAFYKTWQSGPARDPDFTDIRGLGYWNLAENGPFKLSDGTEVSREHFYAIWSGYVTPPYSANYRFKIDAQDYILMTLDGREIFRSTSSGVAESDWMYLKAGERLPLFVMYRKGSSTSSGHFSLKWWHGADIDATYEDIPLSALSSDIAADAPVRVDPDSEDQFGEWTNFQLGPQMEGNAIIHGTTSTREGVSDKMNIAFMSCSANPGIANTSDKGHFMYRVTDREFSIETDISTPTGYYAAARQGLMLRASLDANSPAITVLRTMNNAVVSQLRKTPGGTLTSSSKRLDGYSADTLRIKMVREGNRVKTYYNGELQETYNISNWGQGELYIGFAGASWAAEHMSVVFLSNAEFTVLPRKSTVMVIR